MKTAFLDFATLGPADLDTSRLTQKLDELSLWDRTEPDEIGDRIADREVLVVNKVRLGAAELDKAPQLKLICLAATGADNIDLNAAKEHNITVCNIRAYCTASVAQHVFALILALTQNLRAHQQQLQQGAWQASRDFCLLEPPIRELSGKTLGIIGMGALGSGVTGVARAFNMRVIAARLPWRNTRAQQDETHSAPRLPLHEVLQQSDIISLHCPLNEDTRHLIDATALETMRRDALLINTARGGLIDYPALLNALELEEIGGAGIDVLEEEPPRNGHPLLAADLQNLIVTPHIAWSAREARQRALDEIMLNITAFAAGEERNRVI